MKNLILFCLVSVLIMSSCTDTYNVQLKNGSIVEARNTINEYKYKSGDTVCIYNSSLYGTNWVFSEKMQDTVYSISGTRVDSSSYLYIYEYKIGIIK